MPDLVTADRPAPSADLPEILPGAPAPGWSPARIRRLMRQAVDTLRLDLEGLSVLTEAATGSYAVTPAIAALSGARNVHALAKASRHGSVADAEEQVMALARAAGVADRVHVVEAVPPVLLGSVDIVTNSGHLRPITDTMIAAMRPGSAIALMFEAWEFRDGDFSLEACRRAGVAVAGVNERHRAVGVFAYLGPLTVKQLHDAGVAVTHSRVAVLCDNPFAQFLMQGLRGAGAGASLFLRARDIPSGPWDAVVVALKPGAELRLDASDAAHLATVAGGAVVTQLWGDIDRQALRDLALDVWPVAAPKRGHMGALLSELGPDPIVRLQAGGLKAAELALRGRTARPGGIAELL